MDRCKQLPSSLSSWYTPGLGGDSYKYSQTYLQSCFFQDMKLFSGYLVCFGLAGGTRDWQKVLHKRWINQHLSFESQNAMKASELAESTWLQDQLHLVPIWIQYLYVPVRWNHNNNHTLSGESMWLCAVIMNDPTNSFSGISNIRNVAFPNFSLEETFQTLTNMVISPWITLMVG